MQFDSSLRSRASSTRARRGPAAVGAARVALAGVLSLLVAGCAYQPELPPPVRSSHAPSVAAVDAYNRGITAYRTGDLREAQDFFHAAIEADDALIRAHRAYQETWIARARRGTAIATYRERLADERNGVNLYLAGRLEQDLGERKRWLDEAVQADPHLAWAFLERALIAEAKGDRDAAAADLARAAALAPEDAAVHVNRGNFHLRQGQPHRALDSFYQAIRLDPARDQACYGLFRTHERYRAYGNAMGRLKECLFLRPTSPRYHRALRRFADKHASFTVLGEVEEFMERQLERYPQNPDILHTIGWIRIRTGRPFSAIERLERAAELGADPVRVVRDLVRANVQMGLYGRAFKRFRSYAPNGILFEKDNALRDRWYDLMKATANADKRPTAEHLHALARAYAGVGWVNEALQVYDRVRLLGNQRAVRPSDERDALAAEIRDCRNFIKLTKFLNAYFEKRYAEFKKNGETRSMTDVLRDVARHARLIAGIPDVAPIPTTAYAFLGVVIDGNRAQLHPFVQFLDKFNHYVMLGQRGGGPPEALICERLYYNPTTRRPRFARVVKHRYILGHNLKVRSFRESLDQHLGGITVGREFFVNMDFIHQWRQVVLGTYQRFKSPEARADLMHDRAQPAKTRDEALAVTSPLDVKRRLYFLYCEEAGARAGDIETFLEMVRTHEEGHVLDAERYLPITTNLWRGLSLFLSNSLSPLSVEGHLEGNAELTALAEGPNPRLSLSQLVGFLPSPMAAPPHSVGYYEVVKRICREVYDRADDYPQIDRSRNILQQLHRLSLSELRALGRELAAERAMTK